MIPRSPLILGIICIGILIASAIGINSSNEFSEFIETTPLQHKMKTDSKILYEINELALKHQENNENEKINEQRILMEEKIIKVARDSFGTSNITMLDISQSYFPIIKGSQVDATENQEAFPICDVAENIPAHLQKINDAEMFQMFFKKYSKYELVLNIQDERWANSLFHYGLQAISDDGKYVASTFFHADSCTNEIADLDQFHLSCLDRQNEEWTGGTTNPEYIRASLEHDKFCIIPLSPWYQSVRDYGKTVSDQIVGRQQELSNMEIQTFEDFTRLQSGMEQHVLLGNIVSKIVHDYLEDKETQDMISEYNEKYGDLPDELLDLLDMRPPLSSEYKTKENSEDKK